MHDTIFFLAYFLPNAIALIFVTFAIHAPIVKWRARAGYAWDLRYTRALVVSSKANASSFLVSLVILALIASSENIPPDADSLAAVIGIITWWVVHSNAVFSEADRDPAFTLKNARYFSIGVFGWNFAVLISFAFVVVFLSSAL